MKRTLYFLLLFFILGITSALAQTVTLTFTAKDAGNHYVQLNRVAITNLTKSWQEIIYWPDTTLTMQNGTGIEEHVTNEGFALSQNNPNPFYGTTDVSLTVANEGLVTLEISDVNGKILKTYNVHPQHGTHQFRVSLSTPGTYVMTARQNGKSSSIKMVCNGGGTSNSIDYLGMVHTITYVLKSSTTNPFNFGDMMEYVGYATINGTEMESQRITQAQGASQTFVLLFDVTQNHLPVLTTHVVNNITSSSATVGGIVTADGGAAVFDRGICYSTVPTPTVSDNCVHIGQGTGAFSDNLTGLFPNTTYYVRAYAMNSVGTAYGNEVNFTTTTAIQLPTVITTAVNNVTQTTATCGGNVTSDGGATVMVRGVCWSTSQNPTTADSHTSDGSGTGSFSSSLTGLTANTAYYVRAYATNIAGTTYGNEVSFTTTASAQVPSVTTAAVSNVTETSATCGGNVTLDGGATVTARGVCWSTSQNPTTADSHTTDGSGTGIFTSSITGLTVGNTYHVRAYATNSAGTAYGNEVIFSLPCTGAATVTDIDNNTYNTVQIGNQCWMKENLRTTRYADGTSIALGNSTSTTTAYRYYPDYNSSNVATYGYLYNWKAVMGNSSSSSANPSGVQGICPTGWHVPSDAEWTQLTNYVSSQSQYVCVCTNNYIAKALASTIGWNSSSSTCCTVGNDPSTNNETGFSALPAAGYSDPNESSGFGYFTYFWSTTDDGYWAYCRKIDYNNSGVSTSYPDKSFGFSVRCVRDLPTVTTTAVSSIQPASATCGGNVSSDGGATVTARGVCWSTSQNPTIADSHTIDGNGTGIFTSNITNLSPATQYYVRAYATNIWGTAYGNEVSFITTSQPCQGAATVTDIDNNTYNTVQIGNQCWMKENLRTTRYANGTSIALGSSSSTTTAYRYYPDNSSSNVATYGYLYNWKAVMGNSPSSSANPSGVQGICPTGWHVPSDAEWTQLMDYVSGSISQYQYMCGSDTTNIAKALASTTGWNTGYGTCDVGSNPSANNATGFSALPAGHYIGDYYPMFGMGAYLWSATKLIDYDNDSDLWVYVLTYGSAEVLRTSYFQDYGLSVRCLRNEGGSSTAQLPTVTTSAASNINANSATCGGNVTSDGGATVTVRGVCWSTSQNPTTADSHTSDGSGTGSFSSNLTGLTSNTTYYLRAYATNSVGTTYGNEVIFTTLSNGDTSQDGQPCPNMTTVTDIDGNVYNTVHIGNQCWMADNLRTTRYADNTIISQGSSASTTEAYWYYPNNDASNMPTYGLLYNWKAVMHNATSSSANPSGVQGICPTGWHLPSDTEWTQLADYVSSQNQYVCGNDNTQIAKALASTTGWNSSSGICDVGYTPSDNNATNFNAPPAGVRTYSFFDMGRSVNFWKSTEYNSNNAYSIGIALNVANIVNSNNPKTYGFSVRCVRNEGGSSTAQLPTVTTSAASNITANSATCGGNVTSDGGATVTARGVCWSTSQSPTVNDSHTTDGSGTGSFTGNLTGLTANTTYFVRAYATNSVGTAYGNEVSFTTLSSGGTSQDGQPCPGTPTVTDIDNNTYNTVKIGNQCWMKENLRTTRYANGTSIALGSSTSYTTAYRYYPDDNSSNVATYGYLYNGKAVMGNSSSSSANPSGVQGICPTGWHVPSDAEWTQLTNYVSSQFQYQYACGGDNTFIAKSLASTTGWNNSTNTCAVGNNQSSNNATGFSAFPAGVFTSSFTSSTFGYFATFWSATDYMEDDAYSRSLCYENAFVSGFFDYGNYGLSVRCLCDENGSTTTQLPTVTTSAISNITANSATCGGDVTSDGGATITARGVCWGTNHHPNISNSHTTNGDGTGNFTSNLTGLTVGTTYYVQAYATNSAGTAYGNEVSFVTTSGPCPGTETVTDIDNNTYNTVKIGNQCWMKENLRTTRYANGTSIALGSSTSTTTAFRYYPNNNSSNVFTYGYLYNWKAVMDNSSSSSVNPSGVQGICPTGWHVPSNAEWLQLTGYVSNQSQYECHSDYFSDFAKALASTTGWSSSSNTCEVGNNPSTNNATGFSALPAGSRNSNSYNDYDGFGNYTRFWSATEAYDDFVYNFRLCYNCSGWFLNTHDKDYGFSVRCLRNEGGSTTAQSPTVTTSTASNITDNSATCGGDVTSDGGATVTARGMCWSTTHNPTVSNSHTTDGSGTGSFTSSLTGLTASTTYYVRAYATNSVGTTYGNEVNFTTISTTPFICGTSTLTDVDSNVYNTVQIGNQCWMKENLRTTRYADGTNIPAGTTTSSTEPYYYNYSNSNIPLSERGYLYNWPATMHGSTSSSTNPSGVQGICPTGWHVPSDTECTQLTDYISSQPQFVCGNDNTHIAKAMASTSGWNTSTSDCAVGNNLSNNNATNFSAVPAGLYWGPFGYNGIEALFWTTSESNNDNAKLLRLRHNYAFPDSGNDTKLHGFSVRCVRNEGGSSTVQLPTVTTSAASNITANSVSCGGNVISDGGATVTARGVCWSTSHNPTVSNSYTTDGSGTGSFTSSLTGLTASTTYYARAYATNSAGTAYGNEVSFTTIPTQTQSATIILEAHNVWGDGTGYQLLLDADATAYGTIIPTSGPLTSSGDADATTYAAFEYKIPQNADGSTYTSNMVYDGSVTHSIPAGTYDYCITNPTPGDRIWIAASDNGRKDNFIFQEGYSYHFLLSKDMNDQHDTVSITVFNSSLSTPTVTTTVASNISSNSATCGGNVISDGGATVTARGVCWSTSHNPTVSNSHTSDGSGTGSFTSNLTGLTAGTTYYVRAYATNSTGTVYGSEESFTTLSSGGISQDGQPCPGTATLTDYDGNVYNTVQIGNQCWMAENLRTTHYADGRTIYYNDNIHEYNYPNNNASNVNTYGYLYDRGAVLDGFFASDQNPSGVQGICPIGWHIPSYAEWTQLTDYVSSRNDYVCGTNNSYIAKALASITGWSSCLYCDTLTCGITNGPSLNNSTGFNALPAGFYYEYYSSATNFGTQAYFFNSSHNSHTINLSSTIPYVITNPYILGGVSVRCLRTEEIDTTIANIPCPSASSVIDVDGNVYNTVQIGQQCWMKENLRTTHYADGTAIALGNSYSVSTVTAYRYHPDGNASNVATYGYLYNLKAVMRNDSSSSANPSGVQGICPTGWHVPSCDEWTQLSNYVMSKSEFTCDHINHIRKYCKALASTSGWNSSSNICSVGYDQISNNGTGFSALPAGNKVENNIGNLGSQAIFWSTSLNSGFTTTTAIELSASSSTIYCDSLPGSCGNSVRCLKD